MDWKKAVLVLILVALLLVMVSGCVEPNPDEGTTGSAGVAGFWAGLWHGLTLPVALVASWFTDIGIYETHNGGNIYNLGYFLGLFVLGGVFFSIGYES